MVEVSRNIGWTDKDILTFDLDAYLFDETNREGYRKIVTDIESGCVGALFFVETFRLTRSMEDIQAFYCICQSRDTLIIVGEYVVDLNGPADILLLNISPFIIKFDCKFIQKRLYEAMVHRAERGMLRLPLPVGYIRAFSGRIIKDPNLIIQQQVGLVFKLIKQHMSPAAIVKYFTENGLLFPTGPQKVLHPGALTRHRVLYMLNNPIYAGAYTYRRTSAESQVPPGEEISRRKRNISFKQESLIVCLPESHEGYITWQEYLEIQRGLQSHVLLKRKP
jgi:DNA invertase Pin-like site-specific DNA recombinase